MTPEQAQTIVSAAKTVGILVIIAIVGVEVKDIMEKSRAIRERGGSTLSIALAVFEGVAKMVIYSLIAATLFLGYIKYVESRVGGEKPPAVLPHKPD